MIQQVVAIFADLSEHRENTELLSSPVSSLVSAEQESGKTVHLETQPEEDHHSQAKVTDWPTGHSIHQHKLPEQSTNIFIKATSETKSSPNSSSKSSSHAVSPKPRQRLLAIFRRDKEKTAQAQSPQKEQVNIAAKKEPENTSNLSKDAADMTMNKSASVKHEDKPPEMTEVRTLQLTALQNTPFKEIMTLVDSDAHQEIQDERVVQVPDGLSNLKAFWEKENSGPKIIFTREQVRHEDIIKTGIEASHGPQNFQTDSDVKSTGSNLSPQMEMTVENSASSSSALTECSILGDLSKEDGTYRANPVLIYEETDDSLTGSITESLILEPQENTPVPSPTCNRQKQDGDIPVPLPRQSTSSPQEEEPANISELKHFWETEYTGPRAIAARVKETSSSSILSTKMVPPQSDLSLDNREKYEEEAQTSSYTSKSNVSKPLNVKDRGFVSQSPERSQLRSSGRAEDYSHQVMVESQERPLSPTKSQTPRSKEQEDEVRRSPSKTCHPRVLPRESSSPQRSRLEGSPLKTFPIDINPQTKVVEEQLGKPTPVPRQRKSPSHEVKQTDTKTSPELTSHPLPLDPEDKVHFGNVNTTTHNTQQSSSGSSTVPQFKKASEKKLGTLTRLARSIIPQDFQHYLGPHENAHVPSFHKDAQESDDPTEGRQSRTSSWIVQSTDGNFSQDTLPAAWFLSRASSGSELLNSLFIYISST